MAEIYYLEDIFLAGWIIKSMIHCLTIFTYGIYLDRETLSPFINVINPLKLTDLEYLMTYNTIREVLILDSKIL